MWSDMFQYFRCVASKAERTRAIHRALLVFFLPVAFFASSLFLFINDRFTFVFITKYNHSPRVTYLQEKIKNLFNRIDKNRSGVVSYSELFQMVYKDEAAAQVSVVVTNVFIATTETSVFVVFSTRGDWVAAEGGTPIS